MPPPTADSLARLSSLIDEMLLQPAAERERWIEALAAADAIHAPALREMLTATLGGPDSETRADTLWNQVAPFSRRVLQSAPAPGADLEAGVRIGPYRLIRLLGRGGMGVVWLAERADGAFRREVALKLPYAGAHHLRIAERFGRERDILASLDHPHIARLYDAGSAESGQPYLAMEVVRGEPITVHAQRLKLGVAARLTLFLQVLDAVQYAHNRLVVHRDLKPSNILVDDEGRVHLLDFGIATLIADETRPGAEPLTEVGLAPLTPDYASPEQIERKPISTASDIYSLGVVLFELLCGERPHRRSGDSLHALESAILHTAPTRPSRVVQSDPARFRQLKGDLDNIVLMALKKEAADRYPSADAFAQDLRRHLDGAPVQAHPDSFAYRARKFLGRHRLGVAAGAGTAVALVAGTAIAWTQAVRAEREARKAVAVQEFLVGLFDEADPARVRGQQLTARDLMVRGERDREARLAAHPELSDALAGVLADIYMKLDDPKRALPLAQTRVERLRRDDADGFALGQALAKLARAQSHLSQYDAALQSVRAGLAEYARAGAAATKEAFELQVFEGNVLSDLSRTDEARPAIEKGIAGLTALLGPGAWEVIDAREDLAVNFSRAGDAQRAAAIYAEIEPLLDRVAPERAVAAAYLRNSMGYSQWLAGDWDTAERSLIRVRTDIDALVGRRNVLAIGALRTLGTVYQYRGQYRQALAAFDEATARSVDFDGPDDGSTAINESFRIGPLVLMGRLADAEAAARNCLRIAAIERNYTPVDQRNMSRQMSAVLIFAGRPAEALARLDAIAEAEALQPRRDSPWAATHHYRAGALRLLGRYAQAAEASEKAAAMWAQIGAGTTSVQQAKALLTRAMSLAELRQPAEAAAALAQGRELLAQRFAADHPLFQVARIAEAVILRAEGRADEARRLDEEARAALAEAGVRLPATLPMVL